MSDPTDFLAAEPAETAFARAAALEWNGQILAPFSGRRLIAAQSCGLRIFKLTGQDAETLGTYDGIFFDAVITIYLCAADPAETVLAVRRPEQVIERALAWAEKQNLNPASASFTRLLTLFSEIMEDIMASATEPVPDGDADPQKKTPMPVSTGSPNSPSRSAASPVAPHPTS